MIETNPDFYLLTGWTNQQKDSFISKCLCKETLSDLKLQRYRECLSPMFKNPVTEEQDRFLKTICSKGKALNDDDLKQIAKLYGVADESICVIDSIETQDQQTILTIHNLNNTEFNNQTKRLTSISDLLFDVRPRRSKIPTVMNVSLAMKADPGDPKLKALLQHYFEYLNGFVIVIDLASSTVFYRIDDFNLKTIYSQIEVLDKPIPFTFSMILIAMMEHIRDNKFKERTIYLDSFTTFYTYILNNGKPLQIKKTDALEASDIKTCPYFSYTRYVLFCHKHGYYSNGIMFTVDMKALYEYFFEGKTEAKKSIILFFYTSKNKILNCIHQFKTCTSGKFERNQIGWTGNNGKITDNPSYNDCPLPLIMAPDLTKYKNKFKETFTAPEKRKGYRVLITYRAFSPYKAAHGHFVLLPLKAKVGSIKTEPQTSYSADNPSTLKNNPYKKNYTSSKYQMCPSIHDSKFKERNYVWNMDLSNPASAGSGFLHLLKYVAEVRGIQIQDKSELIGPIQRKAFNNIFIKNETKTINNLTQELAGFLKVDYDRILFLSYNAPFIYFHSSYNKDLVEFYKGHDFKYVNEGKSWRYHFNLSDQNNIEELFSIIYELLEGKKLVGCILDLQDNTFIKSNEGVILYGY